VGNCYSRRGWDGEIHKEVFIWLPRSVSQDWDFQQLLIFSRIKSKLCGSRGVITSCRGRSVSGCHVHEHCSSAGSGKLNCKHRLSTSSFEHRHIRDGDLRQGIVVDYIDGEKRKWKRG